MNAASVSNSRQLQQWGRLPLYGLDSAQQLSTEPPVRAIVHADFKSEWFQCRPNERANTWQCTSTGQSEGETVAFVRQAGSQFYIERVVRNGDSTMPRSQFDSGLAVESYVKCDYGQY